MDSKTRTLTALFLSVAVLSHGVQPAQADIVRYTDAKGGTHFVSDLNQVPEEFRAQAAAQAPLPAVSRVAPGRKELYEQSHYATTESAKKKGGVEIFVTSWCPHCKELENFLDSEKIAYKRYDIERDAKGKQIHDSLGGGGVPVVRIGGKQVIQGFSPQAIKDALKKG